MTKKERKERAAAKKRLHQAAAETGQNVTVGQLYETVSRISEL